MTNKEALYTYCLRLADDALVLGHRLSELCSKAPFIEEDLAQTNIALDMIGRAQALLKYAAEVESKGSTDDDLAYRRPEHKYFNHLLAEQPNGDFAHVVARQLLMSVFELYAYISLERSEDKMIAAIATKTAKEIKYHVQHATDWTIRLGDGTPESKQRMQKAINDLWMYTGELFEMDEVDNVLLSKNISFDASSIKVYWEQHIKTVLAEATLEMPANEYMQTGGKSGVHTEHLGHILSEMQYLQRAYPDAKW